MGAPSFAQFAKGGNHERIRNVVCAEQTNSCVGSIATRPCKKRKDGAPSVEMAPTEIVKGVPPPKVGQPQGIEEVPMSHASTKQGATMRTRSLAVLIIAIWFLLRGGVSLAEILPVVSRVSGHTYFVPVIADSLVWIALGIGLLGQSKIATFLCIGWACLAGGVGHLWVCG